MRTPCSSTGRFGQFTAAFLLTLPFASCATDAPSMQAPPAGSHVMSDGGVAPSAAIERLKDGNRRFVLNQDESMPRDSAQRMQLAAGQHPFAVLLCCSDSRVPPEMVFDQGLGDIFVVRVAGNTIDDLGLGSIEYALEHLGARLVVVMGHEKCGAVQAAVKGGELPAHIPALVAQIKPVAEAVKGLPGDPVHNCVWHNVAHTVLALQHAGPMVSDFVANGKVEVVGAVYDLETGVVRFLQHSAAHGAHAAHGEREMLTDDVAFTMP